MHNLLNYILYLTPHKYLRSIRVRSEYVQVLHNHSIIIKKDEQKSNHTHQIINILSQSRR